MKKGILFGWDARPCRTGWGKYESRVDRIYPGKITRLYTATDLSVRSAVYGINHAAPAIPALLRVGPLQDTHAVL